MSITPSTPTAASSSSVGAPSSPSELKLQAPATLLIGDTGSGKTRSLVTLAQQGLDVFVVVTEPNGVETLVDSFEQFKLMDKLHWAIHAPSRGTWDDMYRAFEVVSRSDFEFLAKMKPSAGRDKSEFLRIMRTLTDFRCARTGKSYGPVDKFDDNCALAVDSLSGLNLMAMDMVVGDKLNPAPGEWGTAMGVLERFLLKCTSDIQCYFILTAHLEKEVDEVSGATRNMASALGRKLAPKLPRFFSEVVNPYRSGAEFWWSTTTHNTVLKKRSLPLGDKLKPDFAPIVDAYRKRKLAASA